jgi:hypothetical protein
MNSSLQPSLQPVFIGGYMHSGTTLLGKILGRHSPPYPLCAEPMLFEQSLVELHDNSQISRWVARSGVDLSPRVHSLWRERGATSVQTMVQNSLRRAGFLSKKS